MNQAAELYNKLMKGSEFGYLTNAEVSELSALLEQAKDLSKAFEAGNACDNYFIQLWYNVEQIRHARRLDSPKE